MQKLKITKFKRSIDDHRIYYSKKNIKEKLVDTLALSDLCRKLHKSGLKVKFSGK